MDASFLIVLCLGLCLLSGMIVLRLGSGGVSTRQIVLLVCELWLSFALWVFIFRSLGAAAGRPVGTTGPDEARDLLARLASLPGPAKWFGIAGAALCIGLCAHLLWSLHRAAGPSTPD